VYDNKNDMKRKIAKAFTIRYQCIYSGEIITKADWQELSYYERFKYSTTFKQIPKHQKILDEGFIQRASSVRPLQPFDFPKPKYTYNNVEENATAFALGSRG
jgi:hypothetical protein